MLTEFITQVARALITGGCLRILSQMNIRAAEGVPGVGVGMAVSAFTLQGKRLLAVADAASVVRRAAHGASPPS